MNEIEIIRRQLATERLHFAEVADTCAAAIEAHTFLGSEFRDACAQYFAFAVGRLGQQAARATASLDSALRATAASSGAFTASAAAEAHWREFLGVFTDAAQHHFAALDAHLRDTAPVTQWRALARIDADAIVTERCLYERVRATLPSGIALAALSAFLP